MGDGLWGRGVHRLWTVDRHASDLTDVVVPPLGRRPGMERHLGRGGRLLALHPADALRDDLLRAGEKLAMARYKRDALRPPLLRRDRDRLPLLPEDPTPGPVTERHSKSLP